MTRYIALLRGINISGKNKIPMPALIKKIGENYAERNKTCRNHTRESV